MLSRALLLATLPAAVIPGCVEFPADNVCADAYGGAFMAGTVDTFLPTCTGDSVGPYASLGTSDASHDTFIKTLMERVGLALTALNAELPTEQKFDVSTCTPALQKITCYTLRPQCSTSSQAIPNLLRCDRIESLLAACFSTSAPAASTGLFYPEARYYTLPGSTAWPTLVSLAASGDANIALGLSTFLGGLGTPIADMKTNGTLAQYSCFEPSALPWFNPSSAANSGTNGENCVDSQGVDYRGMVNVSASGETCLNWQDNIAYNNEFWTGTGDHNYCRSLKGQLGPYCLTANGDANCSVTCSGSGRVPFPTTMQCLDEPTIAPFRPVTGSPCVPAVSQAPACLTEACGTILEAATRSDGWTCGNVSALVSCASGLSDCEVPLDLQNYANCEYARFQESTPEACSGASTLVASAAFLALASLF